jgi:hypothetical protein
MYLLTNATTCLCTLNPTFAQVIVHIPIVIVLNCFPKLATSISWAALNGTGGGQHRRGSQYVHFEYGSNHFIIASQQAQFFNGKEHRMEPQSDSSDNKVGFVHQHPVCRQLAPLYLQYPILNTEFPLLTQFHVTQFQTYAVFKKLT